MSTRPPADPSLERALLVNLAVHALAMLSMALVLLPMLPGGPVADPLERARAIAASPWALRLGWVPWQLCAAVDVWMGVAMARASWLPRAVTAPTLLVTLAAVIPDQWGETRWQTELVELAREAVRTGDAAAFAAREAQAFTATAAWGAGLYTLGALGWTLAFQRAGAWSRGLSLLSGPTWAVLGAASVAPMLPPAWRPPGPVVGAMNALGFVLLEAWLWLAAEAVLRRARPDAHAGRHAPWRYPERGAVGALWDFAANSRVAEALIEPMPVPPMVSDIGEVLYVNHLVEAERLAPLVPAGLELQRLGPDGRYALFTWLTFRHGNFGFEFLGPLRRLLPSPVQTNWRIHVVDPRTGVRGIHFVTNAIDRAPPALAARLTTEGMPMHVLRAASLERHPDGAVTLALDPGDGSAPDGRCALRPCPTPALEGPWRACWGDWRAFLDYCVPQDRAMSTEPWLDRVTRHEIELGLDPARCEPLAGEVSSKRAAAYVGDAPPLCFRVPAVRFRYAVERHDRLGA
ncbi:MAG: DUF2071 domain-containing protein [Polyangiales bacterium]